MAEQLVTAEQVAKRLQISVETVWRYTREGKLPAVKVGNHYRYPFDEVVSALNPDLREGTDVEGTIRMTHEEFSELPEQSGLQLIDGFLVREPSPVYGHQACVGVLYIELQAFVKSRKLGKVVVAPFDVVLADDQVLQPDVMFVASRRVSDIRQRGLFAAPDLAAEVLSPSTRRYDVGRKKDLYYQHGCSELWIIDVNEQAVSCHTRGERDWELNTLTRGDTLISQALPGFSVEVDALFDDDIT